MAKFRMIRILNKIGYVKNPGPIAIHNPESEIYAGIT